MRQRLKEQTDEKPAPPPDPPMLLTVAEIAHHLRCGLSKAWELVMSGQIRTITVGGRRKTPRHEVERYIRSLWQEEYGEDDAA
jgi:excisionase family DNA binding protein